ncbi:dihydrolipoyl dehydrogenase [Spirochaetota bacterium]
MYDLAIIGAGPGGYVAAERAAINGLKTVLIEKDALGGTCLNRGCIPTKSLLAGAKVYRHSLDSAAMGITGNDVKYDLAAAMHWKDQTVSRLVQGVEFNMKKAGVEVIRGSAFLESPKSIKILETDSLVHAKNIIIASGSEPSRVAIPGIEKNDLVLSSQDLLCLKELPKSIVIIGGGVIGVEFASYFSSLGAKVSLIEMLPEILPFMDAEMTGIYRRTLKAVSIITNASVTSIEGGIVNYIKEGSLSNADGEIILVATGRKPAITGLGLEKIGISTGPKGILTDECCKTNVPGIWAIGDVTGKSFLAHSASAMGVAIADMLAGKKASIAWHAMPWVVYGDPEAAGVGMTEKEAINAGYDIKKVSIPARANGRFMAEKGISGHGLVKLVADKNDGTLLGAHLLAPYASEIIWGMQYAVMNKARVHELLNIIFPHPTISELFYDALKALV